MQYCPNERSSPHVGAQSWSFTMVCILYDLTWHQINMAFEIFPVLLHRLCIQLVAQSNGIARRCICGPRYPRLRTSQRKECKEILICFVPAWALAEASAGGSAQQRRSLQSGPQIHYPFAHVRAHAACATRVPRWAQGEFLRQNVQKAVFTTPWRNAAYFITDGNLLVRCSDCVY